MRMLHWIYIDFFFFFVCVCVCVMAQLHYENMPL